MSRRLFMLCLLLFSALLVAGCSYTPARITPEPLIEIGDGHDHGHSDGYFCPPGQAKKGRC